MICPCGRWMPAGEVSGVEQGRYEAGRAFREWAAKNEIAEPPLDWVWFGEIVKWAGASIGPELERRDDLANEDQT